MLQKQRYNTAKVRKHEQVSSKGVQIPASTGAAGKKAPAPDAAETAAHTVVEIVIQTAAEIAGQTVLGIAAHTAAETLAKVLAVRLADILAGTPALQESRSGLNPVRLPALVFVLSA